MTNPKDHMLSWLKDAHAAEEQAITMLSNLARRIENYPELKARIEQHITETRRQAEGVRECLRRQGSDISTVKDTGTKLMAVGQALSGVFTGDEVMKGVLATYTFEHMEIASYRILISTAEKLGDAETARVCRGILEEEQAMAGWLEDHLEGITDRFLALEAAES